MLGDRACARVLVLVLGCPELVLGARYSLLVMVLGGSVLALGARCSGARSVGMLGSLGSALGSRIVPQILLRVFHMVFFTYLLVPFVLL